MPLPEPSPEKLPLPDHDRDGKKDLRAAPSSSGKLRRVALTSVITIGALGASGYAYLVAPTDKAGPDDKAVLAAAAAQTIITPVRVDLDNPREVEVARQLLDLPPETAQKLIGEARQTKAAAASAPMAAAEPQAPLQQASPDLQQQPYPHPVQHPQVQTQAKPGVELAWLTLSDFLDEDGDAVEISTAGLTRTILLKKVPTVIAVPIVAGDFLRLTGMRDGGGGGVTVAVQAGGPEVKVILDEGQTITMPLK